MAQTHPPNNRHHTAFLSLGSNLGHKKENCQQGIRLLSEIPCTDLLARAPFYRTEPVDFEDQDWFVNTAVKIETTLAPLPLLEALKSIERRVGRRPSSVRFGPRVLDLDIILFDQLILDDPQLCIPHPRMHKRRFVLQPICDIEPTVLHPVRCKTVSEMLAAIDPRSQRIMPY